MRRGWAHRAPSRRSTPCAENVLGFRANRAQGPGTGDRNNDNTCWIKLAQAMLKNSAVVEHAHLQQLRHSLRQARVDLHLRTHMRDCCRRRTNRRPANCFRVAATRAPQRAYAAKVRVDVRMISSLKPVRKQNETQVSVKQTSCAPNYYR